MGTGNNPKSPALSCLLFLVITYFLKFVIDVIMVFILSIPFGEDVPPLAFGIYLIPSVSIFAVFAMSLIHYRIHITHFKFGIWMAGISAIVIESVIVPWTTNLPGEDLPLMLTWGTSFLVLTITVVFSVIGASRQQKGKRV